MTLEDLKQLSAESFKDQGESSLMTGPPHLDVLDRLAYSLATTIVLANWQLQRLRLIDVVAGDEHLRHAVKMSQQSMNDVVRESEQLANNVVKCQQLLKNVGYA